MYIYIYIYIYSAGTPPLLPSCWGRAPGFRSTPWLLSDGFFT